jgi:hypothetical protein
MHLSEHGGSGLILLLSFDVRSLPSNKLARMMQIHTKTQGLAVSMCAGVDLAKQQQALT